MKRVPPTNEHIELTLREVLSYTGRPNWLEEEQGELGANKFANAKHRTGPVGRLSGLEIDMVMECHNSLASGGSWNFALKKAPTCTIQVMAPSPSWVKRTLLTPTIHYRTYHGVKVNLRGGGAILMFDLMKCVSAITSGIVLMQIPSKAMKFMLIYCLGHLSRIYHSALYAKFCLAQHVASSAIHVMVTSLVFSKLADSKEGISCKRMLSVTRSALSDFHELDNEEVRSLVLFCFAIARNVNENHFTNYSLRASLASQFEETVHLGGKHPIPFKKFLVDDQTHMETSQSVSHSCVSLGSFLTTASVQDKVGLDQIVTLFDKDRQIHLGERFFLPRFVRQFVLHSEKCEIAEEEVLEDEQGGVLEDEEKQKEKEKEKKEKKKEKGFTVEDCRNNNLVMKAQGTAAQTAQPMFEAQNATIDSGCMANPTHPMRIAANEEVSKVDGEPLPQRQVGGAMQLHRQVSQITEALEPADHASELEKMLLQRITKHEQHLSELIDASIKSLGARCDQYEDQLSEQQRLLQEFCSYCKIMTSWPRADV